MATAKKTSLTEDPVEPPKPLGAFARIKREAAQLRENSDRPKEIEPYVIDDVDPPIVINAPVTVEQQIVVAELTEPSGGIQARNLRPALQQLCGEEAWPRVWELLRREHETVLFAFFDDLHSHFNPRPGVGGSDVPGKSPA